MLYQWSIDKLDDLPKRTIGDIQAAMEYSFGEKTLNDILDDLITGSKQIWSLLEEDEFKATIITQIITHPCKKTCELIYLGGEDMLGMIPELTAIERWAVKQGCKDFEAVGRPGWERILKKHGYERRYVTVGRDL